MKTQPRQSIQNLPAANSVSLYELVKKLQVSLLPGATAKKSFIVNDIVQADIVAGDENKLTYIIGNLLRNAIYRTSDCCIRIETACINGQKQVRIHHNGASSYSNYINSLVHFVDAAKKSGGSIDLVTEKDNSVTVIFSLARQAA